MIVFEGNTYQLSWIRDVFWKRHSSHSLSGMSVHHLPSGRPPDSCTCFAVVVPGKKNAPTRPLCESQRAGDALQWDDALYLKLWLGAALRALSVSNT